MTEAVTSIGDAMRRRESESAAVAVSLEQQAREQFVQVAQLAAELEILSNRLSAAVRALSGDGAAREGLVAHERRQG